MLVPGREQLVAYAHRGVEPKYMGIGPVPAVPACSTKTGLSIKDIDVFEVNEAFAAQALAVQRDLELPLDRPTRTAAASRSATRSAPPAAS